MLSFNLFILIIGVGPKEDLEALKIPVVADLPVGKNLQDHLMMFFGFQTKGARPLDPQDPVGAVASLIEYSIYKTGIAANTALQGTAFHTSGLRNDNSPAPGLCRFISISPSFQVPR